jgi:phosphoribosylglycinamide formyltransferase-1
MTFGVRTGVLISGRGSNLQALIDAARDPAYPAEIVLVISNVPGAGGLARAEAAGIPTETIDHRGFGNREGFEAKLTERLDAAGTALVCQAGFLRVVTGGFVARWRDRLINIHPSLLPAFPGLDTHARALAAGVKLAGCSVHFVREAVDQGPIIGQAAVPVLSGDTADTLAARVLEAEHLLYPRCLALAAAGMAKVVDERVEIVGAGAPGKALINPGPC